jgi:protein-disulfide isomerase
MFILGGITLMVVVLIAGVALVGRQATDTPANSAQPAVAVATKPAPVSAEPNGRAWGPKDAPIIVIEYADYECESCGYFAKNYEHDFVAAFANTGQVRFEIRNAPFHGEGARNAAEAAYCAAEQNMFWPMHDSLFLNQPTQEGAGMEAFSDARLNAIAMKLGLETAAFGQCLSSGKYTRQVSDDYDAALAAGISGTPTFVVNDRPYVGPQSVDDFRRIFATVAPNVRLNS